VLLVTGPAAATTLPPGFVEQDVVCISPGDPAQLAWAPDGDLFIGAKYGKVWVWRAGVTRQIAFLAVSQEIERGVNGLAVDPDYGTNHHLWIYYTTPPPVRNRLSRFTYDGIALVDEVVVIDGPLVQNQNHNGGDIRFARDGTLFVAMGNDDQGALSQDPFDLRGKILRVQRDGSPAPGNPFADGTGGDPRVWALGLRNPYRIAFEPGTDDLFIGDVGWYLWEEVHRGIRGANYGWPAVQGPEPVGVPGYVYPVHSYPHLGSGAAIIGGDFAEAGDFAPEYEGDYFFGDFVRRELYRMKRDARGNPAAVELWATNVPRPSDIEFGPEGALYYVSFGGGGIPIGCVKRIDYVGMPNRQPIARPAVAPDSGLAPLAVTLDGTASSDPDGDALSYAWNPGEGDTLSDPTTVHVYPQGVYLADLTVSDGNGGSDRSPSLRIVSGNRRPIAAISAPADGASYAAGQTVAFSGSATDPEEGALACSRWSWQVLRRHGAHAHPILGPLQGSCGGAFAIADRGDAAADEWYEIVGVATDSGVPLGAAGALSGEHAVAIQPRTATMTFETVPLDDLVLTLDGAPLVAPHSEPGVVDFVRSVGAPDGQVRNGRTYRWIAWSDAGAREHEIRTPAASTTFVASFGCNVLVEVGGVIAAKGPGGEVELSWDPVVDPCLSAGPARYRIYASPTARPASPPGSFPVDPPFGLVGTSLEERFVDPPSAGTTYYLVVAEGTDLLPGPSGYAE